MIRPPGTLDLYLANDSNALRKVLGVPIMFACMLLALAGMRWAQWWKRRRDWTTYRLLTGDHTTPSGP